MTHSSAPWLMRSLLVSVRDLDRSVAFYRDILGLREVAREGEVAVLEGERRTFAIMLRAGPGKGVRHGQDAVGPRSVSFDVGSQAELDEVAERLAAADALVSRRPVHDSEQVEVVTGRDPDGLPLLFITYEADQPLHADHFRHVALRMYGVDL